MGGARRVLASGSMRALLALSVPVALAALGCGGGGRAAAAPVRPAAHARTTAARPSSAPAPGPAPGSGTESSGPAGSPAPTKLAPDPMELDQHVYRVVFANDVVRLLEATFRPGEGVARHRHPQNVLYVVEGGRLSVSQNGLPPRVVDIETGEASEFFALEHAVTNVGTNEVKVLVLEVLSRARHPTMPGRDAIAAAPDIYTSVFENDRVRVLEATIPKGAKVPAHVHPDHVVYVVTPGKLHVHSGALPFEELDLAAGQGMFLRSYGHTVTNVGKTDVKLVVIELR